MDSEARAIKNYPGYLVDNNGNIWSFKKNMPYILSPSSNGKGYLYLGIYNNNRRLSVRIHRLVVEYFLHNWCPKLTVNHIDGNKHNNKAINLEMCTQKDNVRHSWSLGLNRRLSGSMNPQSKLTEEDICLIRRLLSSMKGKDIAAIFEVTPTVISYIKTGKTYINVVEEFTNTTDRGTGGFGSTGVI